VAYFPPSYYLLVTHFFGGFPSDSPSPTSSVLGGLVYSMLIALRAMRTLHKSSQVSIRVLEYFGLCTASAEKFKIELTFSKQQ